MGVFLKVYEVVWMLVWREYFLCIISIEYKFIGWVFKERLYEIFNILCIMYVYSFYFILFLIKYYYEVGFIKIFIL